MREGRQKQVQGRTRNVHLTLKSRSQGHSTFLLPLCLNLLWFKDMVTFFLIHVAKTLPVCCVQHIFEKNDFLLTLQSSRNDSLCNFQRLSVCQHSCKVPTLVCKSEGLFCFAFVQGSSPGPHTCKADVGPFGHSPGNLQVLSFSRSALYCVAAHMQTKHQHGLNSSCRSS